MRAIYDLDDRTYCETAKAWLESPTVRELALLLDINLPADPVAAIKSNRKWRKQEDEDEE